MNACIQLNLWSWFLGVCVLLLCFAPAGADAQHVAWPSLETTPQLQQGQANDVALIIAIERYDHLPDIGGVLQNARDWEIFFRRGLGMRQVYTLINHEATREEMERLAKVAAEAAAEDSRLWVLFIGHGTPAPDGGEGALVGSDARQTVNSLAHRSLPQSRFLELLQQGAQRDTVIVLDTCFSGQTREGDALAEGAMPVVPVDTTPAVHSNVVMMTGARADQFAGALPGASRPAFSYLLLGAMRGWAASENGEVSVSDAVSFARHHLRGVPGREQTPEIVGEAEFVLTRGARETDPLQKQLSIQVSPPTEPAAPAQESSTPQPQESSTPQHAAAQPPAQPAAPQRSQPAPVPQPPTEPAVATVNGETIGLSEFQELWAPLEERGIPDGVTGHFRDGVLEQLVSGKLLKRKIAASDIRISREKIAQRVNEVREELRSQGQDFDEVLQNSGLSAVELHEIMEEALTIELLLERRGLTKPTEPEIRAYYESNRDQLAPASFEESRSQIETELYNKAQETAIEELVDELRSQATIVIHHENLP